MSGPMEPADLRCQDDVLARVEIREGRHADVGGLGVRRVLPTKGRRTVGAWCFVDLAGPADALDPDPMEVGPHPHIGLATLTWLLDGEAVHSDSLDTQQVIRPGQVNLMRAGHGIAHAELAAEPPFRAVQMWLAQPEETRHGAATFEHHADIPEATIGAARALVFAGSLAGVTAPTRTDSPVVGADVSVRAGDVVLPTDPRFEYAVVALDRPIRVGPERIEPGWIGLVPPGADGLPIGAAFDDTRLLLLGGQPLGEPITMWWNFVARDRAEIDAAWRDWRDHGDRFGPVTTHLERIEAPTPPWIGTSDRP
ncbi:MAG: pirin family protein [Nitriliruptoraceae bacterium]